MKYLGGKTIPDLRTGTLPHAYARVPDPATDRLDAHARGSGELLGGAF